MSDKISKNASAPDRQDSFTTLSGIPLERLYSEESLAPDKPEDSIGYPGEFPFTRGIYPTMYRGRFWTMRQYAGFASAPCPG
jgi:methylmalonyl-CoA mutase N-terminal domain/subunit